MVLYGTGRIPFIASKQQQKALNSPHDTIPSCGIVILAAGNSSRLGAPKQLLPLQGKSLLRLAAETAIASGMYPVVVVLGAYADNLQQELSGLALAQVRNENWADGMAGSLITGMQATTELAPELDALIFMVCDQPFVTTSLLHALLTARQESGKPIAASAYAGISGTPALFGKEVFQALRQLTGDAGAKRLIKQFGDQVVSVEFPMGHIDIDTKNDYDTFMQQE